MDAVCCLLLQGVLWGVGVGLQSLFRAPAACLATARRLKLNMCSVLEGSNIAQSLVYAMVDILSLYVDNIWYSDVL